MTTLFHRDQDTNPLQNQCRVERTACIPVAGQQPRDKQIYKSRYWVTVSQTNMFPQQRLNYNEERGFLWGPCRDVTTGAGWGGGCCDMAVRLRASCEPVACSAYDIFFNPEEGDMFLWKVVLSFNGPHGVRSHTTVLFRFQHHELRITGSIFDATEDVTPSLRWPLRN
jgi:hypothetical protein